MRGVAVPALNVLQFAEDCTRVSYESSRQKLADVAASEALMIDLTMTEQLDETFVSLLLETRIRCRNMAVVVADTAAGVRLLASRVREMLPLYTDDGEAIYRLRAGET
jgi:hypothetical protein